MTDTVTTEVPTTKPSRRKYVYSFGDGRAEGDAKMRDLLGGKGAGLAEMTNIGVPVPPGFTITTEVCRFYYANDRTLPPAFEEEQREAIGELERRTGKRLGDAADPLLVSVRSGAKFSMPGMMDTILNLGLNDRSVEGLARKSLNPRFAWDCYRRFMQMFGSVVLGLDKRDFEEHIEALKHKRRAKTDQDLDAGDVQQLAADFKVLVKKHTGQEFPQDPRSQVVMARDAVFRSWMNPRAIYYRKQNRIPDDLGTAVNVQAMVFGNLGDTSATGVGFTRNPATGENQFYGEYLKNAQGEDVVAGIRTPHPIADLEQEMPNAFRELKAITSRLEKHYRDVQDFEFTIQENRLYLLQTRTAKRTAQAAVRIAVEMVGEGLISKEEAIMRVDPASLDQLLHPRIDPAQHLEVIAQGLAASPGAAVGQAVFDADTAARWGEEKKKVILVRKETTPDDIHGMDAAQGILTATGGMTCVAGETRVLTDRGLETAEQLFEQLENGGSARILSFDSGSMQPIWRNIIAAGCRTSEVFAVTVSPTGGDAHHKIRMTGDHKLLVLGNRELIKKPVRDCIDDGDFGLVIDRIPALEPAVCSNARAAEASRARSRTTAANFQAEAVQLEQIRSGIAPWVLRLDEEQLLEFIAGYAGGDGTVSTHSGAQQVQITVAESNRDLLEGIVLSCLRLGVLPQVTLNRDAFLIQVAERVDEILARGTMGDELRSLINSPLRSYRLDGMGSPVSATVYNFEVDAKREIDKNFVVFTSHYSPLLVSNSHAAVVARGMGKPCVSGAGALRVDDKQRRMTVDGNVVSEGDWISLDGSEGRVYLGIAKTIEAKMSGEFGTFMEWADSLRRLGVRANADVPRDAKQARMFGAEGIGLCRTEHMFFAGDRLQWVVQMIMSAPEAKALREKLAAATSALDGADAAAAKRLRKEIADLKQRFAKPEKAYRQALAKLLPLQRSDFKGLFSAMHGYPVTIRTLDPPLHEFLPKREQLMVDIARFPHATLKEKREMAKRYRLTVAQLKKGMPELLQRVEELHEFNPMLGHRGCRLGITYPEITEMQARAIFEAACDCARRGIRVIPEVMIPLVGHVDELRDQAAIVRRVAEEVIAKSGQELKYLVGTMIEVPLAAVTSSRVAEEAEFFSFGTNDLTQLAMGFSRDDSGKFLPEYVRRKILPHDPFVSIDTDGVGELVQWSVERGRRTRPNLKTGICGEHGGDPASIEFFHATGLDYVSCSPFRVPIARIAAAQAAVRGKAAGSDQR